MTAGEIQQAIAIAAAGINRFYDEGMTRWTEAKFRVLFTGATLEEESIQNALSVWEASGAIVRMNQPDCFVEVLHSIESKQ